MEFKGEKGEKGGSFIAVLVSLAIFSMLLMMIVVVIRQLVISDYNLKGRLQMFESLIEVEDFLRKEIRQLQFVPYCSGVLPSYQELEVGYGVSHDYREYLQQSVMRLRPKMGAQQAVLNLHSLRGNGGATYTPNPRKSLQGIAQGSEVLQLSGLLPVGIELNGLQLSGNLTPELVGVRRLMFYATDCQSSLVLEAKRSGDVFMVNENDFQRLKRDFDLEKLHFYVVKEYLIYLQIRNGGSQLVIDSLDGQAFLRMPGFIDLRLEFDEVLTIGLLMGLPVQKNLEVHEFEVEGYSRLIQNAIHLEYREISIGLE